MKAHGRELRHDHKSNYLSADFQHAIGFLSMCSSPAIVRAAEGRRCVERAILTLKEQPLSVASFETVEEPGLVLLQWAELYNEHWLIERHDLTLDGQLRQNDYAHTQ